MSASKQICIDSLELIVWCYIRKEYEIRGIRNTVPAALKYLIKLFSKQIIGSNMLSNKEDLDFIQLLSATKLPNILKNKFKLLYRASENNYSSSKFHELCDGHGPTITIIRSNFDNIFGGYTNVKWKPLQIKESWGADKNAFLFLIRSNDSKVEHPKLFNIIQKQFAVCHSNKERKCGPAFGGGCDLRISDNCNTPIGNKSGLELGKKEFDAYSSCWTGPNTYDYVENELCGSDVRCNNLFFYQVLEYEVFEIQ